MTNGQFQVYTGNGKGKTTAAIGLAVRASGAGLRVYFGQFIKDREYSEVRALRKIAGITVEQYGTGEGMLLGRERKPMDRTSALEGIKRIEEAMQSGKYDVVIADEINVVCMLGLITESEWRDCAKAKPENVELVFTGRGAPECAKELSDLMTEMREVKHYYTEKNLPAREGIEK